DMSDPDNAAQAEDVENILAGLGIKKDDDKRVLEIWNKIDLLDESMRETVERLSSGSHEDARPIPLSAITGEGITELLRVVETRISGELEQVTITLAPEQLSLLDWIYQHASNIRRTDQEDGSVTIVADMTDNAVKILRE